MDATNLGNLGDLVAYLGILVAASVAYGKVVGPYQVELTETVIEALGIRSRYKRVANLATGIVVALAFTGVAGYALGRWELLLPGVFAGFLASVEAGRKHDEAKTTNSLP
ncbi:MAG: hypothetical protein WBA46_18525 [Thermomicrobiales bacterium]